MKAKYLEYGGKLCLVCLLCILGVSGAYVKAKDRIALGKEAAYRTAIREVLALAPDAPDPEPVNPDAPSRAQVYRAVVDGEERFAAQGEHQGYAGPVVVAVGVKREAGRLAILEVRVIAQNETPGLGTRIAEKETNLNLWTRIGGLLGSPVEEESDWFFLKRFRGKGVANLALTGDAGQAAERILRITGVTISSNAATEAARAAIVRIEEALR